MKNPLNLSGLLLVLVFLLNAAILQGALATEKKQTMANPFEVIPDESKLEGLSAKKGGGTPSPPADPVCARGSVGPITHETVSKPCKKDGKDGTKVCYVKWVACLSGPGEPEYASSENCGACMVVSGQDTEQTESLFGN